MRENLIHCFNPEEINNKVGLVGFWFESLLVVLIRRLLLLCSHKKNRIRNFSILLLSMKQNYFLFQELFCQKVIRI